MAEDDPENATEIITLEKDFGENRNNYKFDSPDSIIQSTYTKIIWIIINIQCVFSIDRIILSMTNKKISCDRFFSLFSPDKFISRDNWISADINERQRAVYSRIRKIISKRTGKMIHVLYSPNKFYYPVFMIRIDDPVQSIIDLLMSIQKILKIRFNLNYIELAFDFSPYSRRLRSFLHKHLYFKYNRGNSFTYGDEDKSFYIGDRSKNSRSLIMYDKNIYDDEVLRLEVRLKRNSIDTFGIQLPLDDIINIDFRRIFDLKYLDEKTLRTIIKSKNQSILRNMIKNRSETWILNESYNPVFQGSVSRIRKKIKTTKYRHVNYDHLFKNIEGVNDLFHEKLDDAVFESDI